MKKIPLIAAMHLIAFCSLAQPSVQHLRTENRTNPIGLDSRQQRLTVWRQRHDAVPGIGALVERDQSPLRHLRNRLAGRGMRDRDRAGEIADRGRAELDQRAHDGGEPRPVVGHPDVGLGPGDAAVEQVEEVPQRRAERDLGAGRRHPASLTALLYRTVLPRQTLTSYRALYQLSGGQTVRNRAGYRPAAW